MNNDERIDITDFSMGDWIREKMKYRLEEELRKAKRAYDRNLFRTYNRGKDPTK